MPIKRLKSKVGLGRFKPRRQSVTKQDLKKAVEQIMSKISESAARQKADHARQDAAIEGLSGDVKSLTDKITELQNSAGEITPEDQVLLDEVEARGKVIADKLEALDTQTPPTVSAA